MKDLMFFDANCRIGNGMLGPGPGTKELLADMDRYGVDKALVRHACVDNGALTGNALLAEMLKEDTENRLTGVWCILPDQCDELPPADEFFRQMKENRISALTLDPYHHRYVACRLSLRRIMGAAAERKIPVLLDAFAGKFADMYRFIEEFPYNTYIYPESVGKWGNDRYFRPLLEEYPGFHMDIAGYWIPEGICDLVEKYGPRQILFGSNFPSYNQGNSMVQLKYGGISDDALAAIAGGNLNNLLKGAQL